MRTVVLIGRTNVGKSSLFNRILGEYRAIVSELPHTTRDRNAGVAGWRGEMFRIVDTGGVERLAGARASRSADDVSIEEEIRAQAARAVGKADLLVFVVDVRDGVLPGERAIATFLRTLDRPIIIACNKADTQRHRNACHEFTALGFGDPHPISAKSGAGVGDLLDVIVAHLPHAEEAVAVPDAPDAEKAVRIAIVGEPNVGKSSLINAILRRDEVIVSPEPYTTRDVHDVEFTIPEPRGSTRAAQTVVLLDTAGIRRAAIRTEKVVRKRLHAIERESVTQSIRAIVHADVAVLVLDATRPATRHVKQLAQTIIDRRRACVIVVNKMDLLPKNHRKRGTSEDIADAIRSFFPHLAWATIIFTTAPRSAGVSTIIPAALAAVRNWKRELTEEQLAAIYLEARSRIPTPKDREGQQSIRTIELRQIRSKPPTFFLFTRRRVRLPAAIPRIMEHALREAVDFTGTPVIVSPKKV